MTITITAKEQGGGTQFVPVPRRLHLGGERAEGVDRLTFDLPEAWETLSVSLYVEHEDGKLMTPVLLDSQHSVSVSRTFTDALEGKWMLAATNGAGYTAYTLPGSYDVYDTMDTSGDGTEIPQSQYEQFVSQVIQSASNAANAAAQAQASQAAAADAAGRAQSDADRAEEAAKRAEGIAPEEGTVLSVNGKGGVVVLDAADVGALSVPEIPVEGQMLVVKSVGEDGEVVMETEEKPESYGPGFVKMQTSIPVAERNASTLYFLVTANHNGTETRATNA